MLYTRIFSPKYRNYLRGLTYLILLSFLWSLTSCYTFSEETITPEQLKSKKDYDIREVKTKNDSTINLKKYDVTYIPKPDSTKEILRCKKVNNNSRCTEQYKYKSQISRFDIKLDSISKIKIEISKYHKENTTLLCVAGGLVVVSIIGLIIVGNSMNHMFEH
jgi:hypothetical protein